MSNFPAFSDFKKALQEDNVFVDSFNLFLNLPVFANRLRYVKEAHDFQVHPNPNNKLLDFDQSSVLHWSYSHRLPLFWGSEFYYGYHLGRALFTQSCEGSTNSPHDIAEYISKTSSTKEIQKFLLFLRGSYGEAYCLFWLDVERLKHIKHTGRKKDMMERIKRLYLRNGAPFEFDTAIRKSIYYSSCEAKTMTEEIAVFISSQCQVITVIKKYWLQKYIRQAMKPVIQTMQSDASFNSESSEDEEDEMGESLPRVIIDEGNKKEENAENQREELSNMVETQSVYPAERHKQNCQQQIRATPLFTRSTHGLFGLSNERIEPQNVASFMQACIRCNFAAGNPILSFFKVKFDDNEELENNPTNLLLFWLSIEFLLTRDEMKRWYNSVKSSYLEPDCPYFSLFHEYPLATDLDSLLEMFIDDNSEFFVKLPSEVQSQLHLLIPKGLGKGLLLETQDYVCKKLQPFWEEYIVYENDLFQSHCVKRKDICHLSDAIQKQQSKLYHESRKAKNVMCSRFNLRDRLEIKRIWKAVEFTEAMVNPGLLHLPSRLSMQVYSRPVQIQAQKSIQEETTFRTSTPGDIGPISYKGINLIPMITTVSTKVHRTAFKLVRTTIYSSQPATMTAKLLKKPSIPGLSDCMNDEIPMINFKAQVFEQDRQRTLFLSFSDMMKNPDHIESFYNFLASNGNGVEMGLVFWLAIEDMKDSISDINNCRNKIRRIMRRFFKEGIDMTMYCKDTSIVELSSAEDPDPFALMDAQAAIFKSLERTWYEQYLNYLTDTPASAELMRCPRVERRQRIQPVQKSTVTVQKHSKELWSMFAKNVIGFRRGTMDPQVLQLFKKYLAQEILKGDIYEKKKIVGNKVVNVTKLLNDLSFWAEVERYKDMADVVRAAKNSGTYTPEDEIMVYKKAHAIVNCYMDSSVPPKIQVNVASEVVATILENLSSRNIGRGLFHEAALNIFSILILYWKRFCVWRWSSNKSGSSSSVNSHSTTFSYAARTGGKIQLQDSDDHIGGCILSFSLRKGLRLIIPPTQAMHYATAKNPSTYTKVQVHKIESARAMISKHISRITSVQ